MADIVIKSHNSEEKPFDLRSNYNSIAEDNMKKARQRNLGKSNDKDVNNPVPWIRIGNLYLSAFETGDTSWMPIVKVLAKESGSPKKLFTILTGRHGDAVHLMDPTRQFVGVAEAEHLNQDLQRVAELKKDLPKNVDMLVVDVTDPDFNSPLRLRNWVAQNLQAGRVVVLAWCYSIYALRGIPSTFTKEQIEINYMAHTLKTIEELAAEDWQFALGS